MPPCSKSEYSLSAGRGATENEFRPDAETEEDPEYEEEELRYGWGSWKPKCLQAFNCIRWYVFWTSVFSLFQGFTINGVTNAIISSLETRFELPSSLSGLIISSNDFLALFLVLVISYYGATRNKPRLIAAGILILGLGSFVFALPHFITGVYNYKASDVHETSCREIGNTTECGERRDSYLQKYVYIFMLGNALHGAGATPMFTLGTTFIDENTQAKMTSLYLGIVYAAASVGVAAGYTVGGQFLTIFTDVDKVDVSKIDLTPVDPRWVGAWWVSFIISGGVMFIIAIPMLAYPRVLPGSAAIQAARKSEAYQDGDSETGRDDFGKTWRDFPRAMWSLIKNPTFFFLSLASCMGGMAVSGMAAFGAKFLQEQFNLQAAYASMIMGVITVPGAGGGMLLGGYIVKKMDLKCRGIIRLSMTVCCIALVVGGLFLIQCPKPKMAGVTVQYSTLESREGKSSLKGPCNSACHCSELNYEPVCGADNVIYFSPCHAGCSLQYDWTDGPMGPMKMYKKCSCVESSLHLMNISTLSDNVTAGAYTTTSSTNNITVPGALAGICPSDCNLLYVVAPLLFLGMLLTFTVVSPSQTATLRCVPGGQRSLAIGFQWLFLRLGGTTPGPLMLGTIIDSACRVWQDICGQTGSCWIYEKSEMGIRIFVWWILVKGFAVLFFFLAQYFYKPPPEDAALEEEKHDLKKTVTDRESVF
ncbi:solute carrier organic anion transporter family member 4A1-like isoform X2 [Haliotis rufescens]|uniref:solute carrier organic anion transporter family member 4A1-like isoform X2 n=1 Tax=Haliotis rufescens TaxID=6454 RepID=UPI00201F6BA2|nr:solute carrier organic anion transporter family member 4A1-like isoform X2 [Haliotis rufescens]